MSLYIVREARELGAPRHLIARMLVNVALDGVVGAVPLLGDAFDVMWRANRRNMALLRNHLAARGAAMTRAAGRVDSRIASARRRRSAASRPVSARRGRASAI